MSDAFAKGFRAGVALSDSVAQKECDVAVLVNNGPRFDAAAVFPRGANEYAAHQFSGRTAEAAEIMESPIRALVFNSGNGNRGHGAQGYAAAAQAAATLASRLPGATSAANVLVGSTGPSESALDMDVLLRGIDTAYSNLSVGVTALQGVANVVGGNNEARAFKVEHSGVTLTGFATRSFPSGSQSDPALIIVATDALICADEAAQALNEVLGPLDEVDGALLLASGASGVRLDATRVSPLLAQLVDDAVSAPRR